MVAGEVAIPRLASPGLHTSFTLNSRFAHARNRRIVLRYRGNHEKNANHSRGGGAKPRVQRSASQDSRVADSSSAESAARRCVLKRCRQFEGQS
jgi:hypothetical protein